MLILSILTEGLCRVLQSSEVMFYYATANDRSSVLRLDDLCTSIPYRLHLPITWRHRHMSM